MIPVPHPRIDSQPFRFRATDQRQCRQERGKARIARHPGSSRSPVNHFWKSRSEGDDRRCARSATAKRQRHARTTRRRYVLEFCAHGFGERPLCNLGWHSFPVGTRVAPRPPGHRRRSPASGSHRTWRADFPHHALRRLINSCTASACNAR